MKNIKFSAVLFTALTLVQALLTRYVVSGMTFAQMPAFLVFECYAIFAFAAVTLWLIGTSVPCLCNGAKKVIAAGGVMYLAFVLINIQNELAIVQSGLSSLSSALTTVPLAAIGALVVKLLLLVVGVVFAVLPDKEKAQPQAEIVTEATAEAVVQEQTAQAEENG